LHRTAAATKMTAPPPPPPPMAAAAIECPALWEEEVVVGARLRRLGVGLGLAGVLGRSRPGSYSLMPRWLGWSTGWRWTTRAPYRTTGVAPVTSLEIEPIDPLVEDAAADCSEATMLVVPCAEPVDGVVGRGGVRDDCTCLSRQRRASGGVVQAGGALCCRRGRYGVRRGRGGWPVADPPSLDPVINEDLASSVED
jgi:hypothetical protein